jgi:predicted transcriptional regulator
MGRLTVRLPDTLHRQIKELADREGISMNQYIVYALTQKVTLAYTVRSVPDEDVRQQARSYAELLRELGRASSDEIRAVLRDRAAHMGDQALSSEEIQQLRERLTAFQESAESTASSES